MVGGECLSGVAPRRAYPARFLVRRATTSSRSVLSSFANGFLQDLPCKDCVSTDSKVERDCIDSSSCPDPRPLLCHPECVYSELAGLNIGPIAEQPEKYLLDSQNTHWYLGFIAARRTKKMGLQCRTASTCRMQNKKAEKSNVNVTYICVSDRSRTTSRYFNYYWQMIMKL
jgi:hypothetical protein